MNLFSLNDQVILVTGSSRGLGWEMAKAMAEAGATVILNGRDRELLSKRQTELEKAGLKSAIQAFDAANENEVLKWRSIHCRETWATRWPDQQCGDSAPQTSPGF